MYSVVAASWIEIMAISFLRHLSICTLFFDGLYLGTFFVLSIKSIYTYFILRYVLQKICKNKLRKKKLNVLNNNFKQKTRWIDAKNHEVKGKNKQVNLRQ